MTALQYWVGHRPKKYSTDPIDRVRYAVLQQALDGYKNFVDEEHPRSGKSEANNLYGPAWWLSTHPNFKFGLITHSQALGNKFVGAVANLLREDGFQFEYERSDQFKLAGSAGIDPSFWASGISGGHTGKGCHRLLVDDVLRSGSDALSEKIREGIITDVISTAMNRLEPYNGNPGAVTFCQARLHEADPVGWLIRESGLPYIRAHFPATNDSGTEAYIEDTHAASKQFLPAYDALTSRYPREKLDEVKGFSTQYWWSAQWLMEPKMGDANYFDLSKCARYQAIGNIQLWIMGCDFANTQTETGSRTAFVALGWNGSRFLVLNSRAGRWKQDEMGDRMEEFYASVYRLTGKHASAVVVEQAAAGYGIIDRYSSLYPIIPVVPKGSKEIRAGAVAYIVNRGSVMLPEDAAWLKEFSSEVGGFPLQAQNDIPDALVHCLSFIGRPSEFKPVDRVAGVAELSSGIDDPDSDLQDFFADEPGGMW
jgi:predicted phage terminase large subunit-like protein